MGFTPTDQIWFNGRLVPWREATVHVTAHGLHYGTGVFEGIRVYPTPSGPAVFRLDAHLERFFRSASLYEIQIPYSLPELTRATLDIVRANQLESAYLRPIAFLDAGSLGLWTKQNPVSVAIAGYHLGAYMDGGLDRGVRATISPIRRFENSAIPADGKSCGQYINSIRATQDAQRRGFDEAILLNARGEVAEGPGENVFLVKNGVLQTNDIDAGILMGITRSSILEIARDLGIPARVGPIGVADLTSADELFFCGTAVEITPIRQLDVADVGTGRPGAITRLIQQTFFEAARGQRTKYRRWLAPADESIRA
jgi:branched-chain amino acid aminotransferase